jgi:NitT/TauT family transport system permease protein
VLNKTILSEKGAFAAGIVVFCAVWFAGAGIVNSNLILPGPLAVITRFIALLKDGAFYKALGTSAVRLFTGLVISAPAGFLAGLVCGLNKRACAFFRPLFTVIASTPVMSVILIAYLALGADRTPVFTVFLLVFPIIVSTTIEGLQAVSLELRELFEVYRLGRMQRLRHLYLPVLMPFLTGGIRAALALGWKVVVAAEVLVQPMNALGSGIQRAKAYLETVELFAWTLAVILAAALSDVVLRLCAQSAGKAGL